MREIKREKKNRELKNQKQGYIFIKLSSNLGVRGIFHRLISVGL